MNTLNIGTTQVLIGLTWAVLPEGARRGPVARTAARKILANHPGTRYAILLNSGKSHILGMAVGTRRVPSAPSGAALLAIANRESRQRGDSVSSSESGWVILHKTDDGRVWRVQVNEGIVDSSSDTLTDPASATNQAIEFLSESQERNILYTVFTNDATIEEEIARGGHHVVRQDTGDLIKGTAAAQARLSQMVGIPPRLILAGSGLLLFAAGWYGYGQIRSLWEHREQAAAAAEHLAQVAAKTRAAQRAYAAAVQAAVARALTEEAAALDRTLSGPPPVRVFAVWSSIVLGQHLDDATWMLSAADCAPPVVDQVACTIHRAAIRFSTNAPLRAAHANATIGGDAAAYAVEHAIHGRRQGHWRRLPTAAELESGLENNLQLLRLAGIHYQVSASSSIAATVALPPLPTANFHPGQAKAPTTASIPMGVGKGTIVLQGRGMWRAADVMRYMNGANLMLQKLHMTVDANASGVTWTMEWVYEVRTAPQPTLPVIKGIKGTVPLTLPAAFRAAPR